MTQEEREHLFDLVWEQENWSEAYHMGLMLMRNEEDLKSTIEYLTITHVGKAHIECIPEVLEYAREKAREQGLTPQQIKDVLWGF